MLTYKIRDKTTGLFSTGGTSPKWSKLGKTWQRHANLLAHFREKPKYNLDKIEIVVFQTLEVSVDNPVPYVEEVARRHAAKELKYAKSMLGRLKDEQERAPGVYQSRMAKLESQIKDLEKVVNP